MKAKKQYKKGGKLTKKKSFTLSQKGEKPKGYSEKSKKFQGPTLEERQAERDAKMFKRYKGGGKLPPAIKKMKERAAQKKAKKAPIKGGMLAETTVTAKAPKKDEMIKREANQPIGAKQRFFGDPSGSGFGAAKAALSFIARTGKKTNALKSTKSIAGKIMKNDMNQNIELMRKSKNKMDKALDSFGKWSKYQGKGVYGSKQLKSLMRKDKNAALREAKTQDAISSQFGLITPNRRDQVIKAVKASKK